MSNQHNVWAPPPSGTTPPGHVAPGHTQGYPTGYPPPGHLPGQPPAPGHPYGYVPGYAPMMPPPPLPPLASWGRRVAALLVDRLIQEAGLILGAAVVIPLLVASETDPSLGAAAGIGVLLWLLVGSAWSLFWWIFDRVVRQGRTGRSVGKRLLGLRLVTLNGLVPVGEGVALGREFAHLADAYSMFIGYLWPIWDERRQTFADKMCSTVVQRVDVRTGQAWG